MRRALAIVLGGALSLGLFLATPADVLGGTGARLVTKPGVSVRQINYRDTFEVRRSRETLAAVEKGAPAGVTTLYVMGSSDFGVNVPENPANFLPARSSDFDMYLSGHGNSGPLGHAIELGAMADLVPQHKVTLLLSPQWFMEAHMSAEALRGSFSLSMWQQFEANPSISAATKARLRQRLTDVDPSICDTALPCGSLDSVPVAGALPSLARDVNAQSQLVSQTLLAERTVIQGGLGYQTAPGAAPLSSLEWEAECAKAAAAAAAASHNPYGFDDGTYASLQGAIAAGKSNYGNAYRPDSDAYGDLDLFLAVARELGIQVQVISVPLNAQWSDRIGMDAAQRAALYAQVNKVATAGGAKVTDLTGHEAEPYFFNELIHLGRVGWLRVIKAGYDYAMEAS